MIYILSGPDDFSLNQSLVEIKKGLGDQGNLAANTTVLDGQQVASDQLTAVCSAVPFLAEKRLVIINGLLEHFEARSSRRKKAASPTSQQDEAKALSACMGQIPESTVVVLIEGKIANDNPLFKELVKKATLKTFPLLKEPQLSQWVRQRVAKEGGTISPQAVDSLVRHVGSNLWTMASEINKLVLFAAGRRIEEEDIKRIVSHAQQASIFTVVDAIVENKTELAQRSLEQLLQGGATPSYVLFMLARQVQFIVRVRELKSKGKPEAFIQTKLGLADFALRKTLEQASKYSLPRLKEVYQRLLETDMAIKTGRYAAELALNILVAELCQRSQAVAHPKAGVQYAKSSRT